jgi:outer membrane protein TolC
VKATDRPEDFVHVDIDAASATQRAFQHRPEMAIIDDRIERQIYEKKFAKNQRLPALNVQLSYGNLGLAGKQTDTARCRETTGTIFDDCLLNPTHPLGKPVPRSSFGDSLDDFLTQDSADQFSARAVFSIPIPNTAARARASQADIELRRIKTEKRRIEQTIILEVRNAVRNMKSTYEGIVAARRSSAASAEQLRAERIRLEYGESTPFDVLQREEDFVQSRSREIDALRLYRVSVTSLHRAQGSILSNRNIVIDAVRALR